MQDPSLNPPITFRIDPARNLAVVTFEGSVGDADLMGLWDRLGADADWRPGLDALVDLAGLETLEGTALGLRNLVALSRPHRDRPAKTAIVAPADHQFALGRQWSVLAGEGERDIRVFRAGEPALRWLGIEPDPPAER